MMFERFTASARSAVVTAQELTREFNHSEIGAEHLLLAVADDNTQLGGRVLSHLGMDRERLKMAVAQRSSFDGDALASLGIHLDSVRRRAEATFGEGALDRPRRRRAGLFKRQSDAAGGFIPFSREAKSALEGALRAAVAHQHRSIGTEHLLLGLLSTKAATALALLGSVGVVQDARGIEAQVLREIDREASS